MTTIDIGRLGVWTSALRQGDPDVIRRSAAELEALGFGALWTNCPPGADVFGESRLLLESTERVPIAVGVLNIWMLPPEVVAEEHRRLDAEHPGRFLLGVGVSHSALVDPMGHHYAKPLEYTTRYLERLNELSPELAEHRVLGALGPRMMELARDATAGAHPYLTTPGHTAEARRILGPGKVLAVEQKVYVDDDPVRARELARPNIASYGRLDNYRRSLLRMGFTDEDLADGGSDRLLDGLIAAGPPAVTAQAVQQHLDAGADHVCVQVLSEDRTVAPVETCRRLAEAMPDLLAAV